LGVLLWLVGLELRSLFNGVDPGVASAVATGFFAFVVTLAGVLSTRYYERRKALDEQIRARKTPIYEELIEGLFAQLHELSDGGEIDAGATANLLRRLTPKLIIWGSDDVVVAWSRWRRDVRTLQGAEVLFAFESLLSAIRKDLGHKGTNVVPGDLLGLFVNDTDYLPARTVTKLKPAS
jgi:hypothetical protein